MRKLKILGTVKRYSKCFIILAQICCTLFILSKSIDDLVHATIPKRYLCLIFFSPNCHTLKKTSKKCDNLGTFTQKVPFLDYSPWPQIVTPFWVNVPKLSHFFELFFDKKCDNLGSWLYNKTKKPWQFGDCIKTFCTENFLLEIRFPIITTEG